MFSVFEGSCRASEPLGLQPAKSHKNPQRRRSSGLGRGDLTVHKEGRKTSSLYDELDAILGADKRSSLLRVAVLIMGLCKGGHERPVSRQPLMTF